MNQLTAACSHCGKEIEPRSAFCPACGVKLTEKPPIKAKYYLVFLLLVVIAHGALLAGSLNRPFTGANEDDNALYGLGALNLAKFGFINLKLGMVPKYVDSLDQLGSDYYTHHPQLFILPTAFLFKLFGASDAMTRLSSMIFALFSLVAFYLTIYLYYDSRRLALFSSLVYALLPGLVHYNSSLSEKVFVIVFFNFLLAAFFLFRRYPTRLLKHLVLAVVVIGGFMGWHFYFAVAALWFYVFLNKETSDRRFFLFALPFASALTFSANFLHFYLLRGSEFIEIFEAFGLRSSGVPPILFLRRYGLWLSANFTWPVFLVGTGFLIYCIYRSALSRKFELPLIYLVMPLMVLLVFREWSTHAFGPIYWAPFLAFSVGYLLNKLITPDDRRLIIIGLALAVAFISFVPGNMALFRSPSMVTGTDVRLLMDMAKKLPLDTRIAMGRDYSGKMYGQVVGWYLKRDIGNLDWRKQEVDYILGFNPKLGLEYQRSMADMARDNYVNIGTSGYFVLLKRDSALQ